MHYSSIQVIGKYMFFGHIDMHFEDVIAQIN